MILHRFTPPSLRPLLPALLLGLSLPLTSPAMASAPDGEQPAQAASTGATPLDQLAQKKFPAPDGSALDVATLKGKPVVINFWATWCPPCIREMPDLANLARELGDDATIIGIAADSGPHVQKFTEKTPGIDFPLLMAGYKALNLSKQWGNEKGGLPFTVVLDAQGQIHWRHSGALDIEALRSMLKSGDLH